MDSRHCRGALAAGISGNGPALVHEHQNMLSSGAKLENACNLIMLLYEEEHMILKLQYTMDEQDCSKKPIEIAGAVCCELMGLSSEQCKPVSLHCIPTLAQS
jgi:hypothetical protein